jgi:hypothetical protein
VSITLRAYREVTQLWLLIEGVPQGSNTWWYMVYIYIYIIVQVSLISTFYMLAIIYIFELFGTSSLIVLPKEMSIVISGCTELMECMQLSGDFHELYK